MIERLLQIKPQEIRAALASFLLIVLLMCAYYVLRSAREGMVSDWTDAQVSFLWTINFFISVAAVWIYTAIISRVKYRFLVPGVYGFFGLSFIGFYLGSDFVSDRTVLDQSFYVWVSFFAMFHVSVFWSFMADIYTKQQSLRLFGFIAAGASIGALLGSSLVLVITSQTYQLMLIAAAMLFSTMPFTWFLNGETRRIRESGGVKVDQEAPIGGNWFAGFSELLKSPMLRALSLFLFLYVAIGAFFYFEIKHLLDGIPREVRTEIYAWRDLAYNVLTIITAMFATGRLTIKFGMPTTLALVPILLVFGQVIIIALPALGLFMVFEVLRRAGNYGVTRPAREMLYTAVDREARFKVKPVIDVLVYRGGDVFWAWAFTWLTQGLGLGFAAVAGVCAGIAAVWGGVGVYLGRLFQGHGAVQDAVNDVATVKQE